MKIADAFIEEKIDEVIEAEKRAAKLEWNLEHDVFLRDLSKDLFKGLREYTSRTHPALQECLNLKESLEKQEKVFVVKKGDNLIMNYGYCSEKLLVQSILKDEITLDPIEKSGMPFVYVLTKE